MEVGSWEKREVGEHRVESVQPPLDVEGRAPVEEDFSKSLDDTTPSTLLPPCHASREGGYHALGKIHEPPSVLSAP